MKDLNEFPFQEIKDTSGDYFSSYEKLKSLGYKENQIWSVTSDDQYITYGPLHHYVNLLGYVATTEHHDGNTYYYEEVTTD